MWYFGMCIFISPTSTKALGRQSPTHGLPSDDKVGQDLDKRNGLGRLGNMGLGVDR